MKRKWESLSLNIFLATIISTNKFTYFSEITGFLKIKFSLRTHRYKLGLYGLGVITDGQYKINVTIARYVDAELDIQEGATVTVTGVAKVVEGKWFVG